MAILSMGLAGVTASADPDAPVSSCTSTSSCTYFCNGGNLLTVVFNGIGTATGYCGNGRPGCANLQPDVCHSEDDTTTGGTGDCKIHLGGFGTITCTASTG